MQSPKENFLELALQCQNDGAVCLSQGDNKAADFLYRQAHTIIIASVGSLHRLVVENLLNLGIVNGTLGFNRKARERFSSALKIACSIGLGDDPLCIAINTRLVNTYIIEGDFTAAESIYSAFLCIQLEQPQTNLATVVATRTQLADLYAKQGSMDKSLLQIDCIRKDHDRLIQSLATSLSCEQSAAIDHVQLAYYFALSLCLRYFKNSSEANQAMVLYTFRRKNLQMELELIRQQLLIKQTNESKSSHLKELEKVRRRLTNNTLPCSKMAEHTDVQYRQLHNDESQRKLLEEKLTRMLAESSVIDTLLSIELDEISGSLSQEESYIEFVRYRRYDFADLQNTKSGGWKEYRYLAFVIRADSLKKIQLIDLGEAESIDQLVKTFRAEISKKFNFSGRGLVADEQESSRATHQPGIALRQRVFDPLESQFRRGSKLILVLDGALWAIPFGTLPLDDGAGYLNDQFNIRYLNSGRELIKNHKLAKKKPFPSLVIADPEANRQTRKRSKLFSFFTRSERKSLQKTNVEKSGRTCTSSDLSFELLPGAGIEAEIVADLLGAPVLRGFKARKKLFQKASSPYILHFATHACFFSQQHQPGVELEGCERHFSLYAAINNPMLRSVLLLADKPSTSPEPISAEQILGLDLQSTELVVLSACDSGLGEIKNGEGVFGLRRAFMLAGVNSVIVSLWQVADLPTTLLMAEFYRNFTRKHQCIADSLLDAQAYLQKITVSELYANDHTAEIIETLCTRDPGIRKIFDSYIQQPQSFRPFADPYYWGGFVFVGKSTS